MKFFNVNERDFNPWDYVKEGDEGRTFLPLAVKKAWFRSKFPQGVIRYRTLAEGSEHIKVEALVYTSNTAGGDEFIGSGISYATPDMVRSEWFLTETQRALGMESLARGKAAARALTDAGFGLQFYLDEPDPDEPAAEDTPDAAAQLPGGTAELAEKREAAKAAAADNAAPAQKAPEPAPVQKPKNAPAPAPVQRPEPVPVQRSKAEPAASRQTGQGNIYSNLEPMTLDEASKVVVDCGKGYNKEDPSKSLTIGQIASNYRAHLSWVYKETKSRDVRRAIKAYAEGDPDIKAYLQHMHVI